MRRWTAMIGALAAIGCGSVPKRASFPERPTEYDVRKDRPELQKHFRTSMHRVYSAGKVALHRLEWQIAADRLLGKEAKIEAQQARGQRLTIFFEHVTPIRTRVAVLVSGASTRRAKHIASDVHEEIAKTLRIKAED